MVLNGFLLRLQNLLRPHNGASLVNRAAKTTTATTTSRAGRIRPRLLQRQQHPYQQQQGAYRTTTGLDVARFGLLSIATLPFSLWIAVFSYDYVKRVDLCRDALTRGDEELAAKSDGGQHRPAGSSDNNEQGQCLGRDEQLGEVRTLLSKSPHQIVVVAGANESGKSRFVSELLRSVDPGRGVTYVQLAQLVDSVSTATHVFVEAFDLRWLQMRYSLVDVLPFAGSEILVMKERYSDRDLAQALRVVTEALKRHAAVASSKPGGGAERPVIVIDGLGEGNGWMRSREGEKCLQRLLQWCIYVTKERRLAHVVLTGNEQLVLSLTDQNRMTRGHVKVVGLGDLDSDEAGQVVLQEVPDATDEEIKKITATFGGFVHDLHVASRDIQYRLSQGNNAKDGKRRAQIIEEVVSARFRLQIERVTAAFAKGKDENEAIRDGSTHGEGSSEDEDDMDPFLDPLKSVYSEAQASESDASASDLDDSATWSQLQLWQTLQRLVDSDELAVPFATLRDDIYDGDKNSLLGLMQDDVLGFEVDGSSDSGWSWKVKPATPALGRAFQHLVNDSDLKERFDEAERVAECQDKTKEAEKERINLWRERRGLDLRKASLLSTVALGKELGRDGLARQRLAAAYDSIVAEEAVHERRDRELRDKLDTLAQAAAKGPYTENDKCDCETMPGQSSLSDHASIQRQLKSAVLQMIEGPFLKGEDKFSGLRKTFRQLGSSDDGAITATDVARVIKTTTGKDVDLEAAKALVRAWDANNDRRLSYDEFVRMLLTDPKDKATTRRRNENSE